MSSELPSLVQLRAEAQFIGTFEIAQRRQIYAGLTDLIVRRERVRRLLLTLPDAGGRRAAFSQVYGVALGEASA